MPNVARFTRLAARSRISMNSSIIVIAFATILLATSCYGGKSESDPVQIYKACKKMCNVKFSSCVKQCFNPPKPARRERCLNKWNKCKAKCARILQKAKI
ncbi:hypothetical protein LSAT2_008294 [Lamellibrachia satsuma]|nr:hypothetical protein LSAT2_008294 [Lamellibrachia satsuma]